MSASQSFHLQQGLASGGILDPLSEAAALLGPVVHCADNFAGHSFANWLGTPSFPVFVSQFGLLP
jgi:hypothetical protein